MATNNIGTPEDGPLWTVVGVYEDVDDPQRIAVFHVHAAHLPGVLAAVKASQERYDAAMENDPMGEKGDIPSSLVDPVVFAGALTALN